MIGHSGGALLRTLLLAPTGRQERSWHGGPAPKHQPTFSEEDRAVAQAIVNRQHAPHAQVQRAQLSLIPDENPEMTCVEAGRRLCQSPSWVRKRLLIKLLQCGNVRLGSWAEDRVAL
jgi:hypothetical protein